ncbi:MAG TPA: LacI family DNA-binding transcriptional regulator [Kineosporiaceae bacterium]|nr:LacI family DNA-binding transcriptional regulator [Kineosporiaceae bacterium]
MSTADPEVQPDPAEDPVSSPGALQRRPAMYDVARLAGVSHQTVSRVLNLHPSVSPRTRTLVLAAIDELGYRPNSAARTLATGRSKTLGVITLAGTLYGPMSMLYGVEAAARDQGYMLTIVSVRDGEEGALERAVANLHKQRVDGIVAIAPLVSIGESLTALAQQIPLVAVESSPRASLPIVSVDQAAGARIATDHLLAQGHRTVWHVSGPAGWYESQDRTAGWAAALAAAGAEVPPALSGDWSPRSGYEAGQIIGRMPDVTAVFVANDQMALGVLRALNEHGRRVPNDVSLVGFDDIPESGFFSPPLTTVRQPFDMVGRRSLQTLLAEIESGQPAVGRVVIAPELIVRESTARPSSN